MLGAVHGEGELSSQSGAIRTIGNGQITAGVQRQHGAAESPSTAGDCIRTIVGHLQRSGRIRRTAENHCHGNLLTIHSISRTAERSTYTIRCGRISIDDVLLLGSRCNRDIDCSGITGNIADNESQSTACSADRLSCGNCSRTSVRQADGSHLVTGTRANRHSNPDAAAALHMSTQSRAVSCSHRSNIRASSGSRHIAGLIGRRAGKRTSNRSGSRAVEVVSQHKLRHNACQHRQQPYSHRQRSAWERYYAAQSQPFCHSA